MVRVRSVTDDRSQRVTTYAQLTGFQLGLVCTFTKGPSFYILTRRRNSQQFSTPHPSSPTVRISTVTIRSCMHPPSSPVDVVFDRLILVAGLSARRPFSPASPPASRPTRPKCVCWREHGQLENPTLLRSTTFLWRLQAERAPPKEKLVILTLWESEVEKKP
jgi:hypothetical protein